MLTNFEEITADLTEEELKLIPFLVTGFKTHLKGNEIKAPDIVKGLNAYFMMKGIELKLTEVKLRKCVNYIRSNAILPVIATSVGYYVSYDKDEIRAQVKSLQERARSILVCADGLERFL